MIGARDGIIFMVNRRALARTACSGNELRMDKTMLQISWFL